MLTVAGCAGKVPVPSVPGPVASNPPTPYEDGPNGTRFYKRGGRSLLIFVHGVSGSAEGTWKNDETGSYRPELVLNDTAFKNFDVYVVGYNTPKFSNALNLEQLSGNLEVQLRSAGLFNYDAVFVIAHSMGGLIVKRILTGLAIDADKDLQKVKAVFLIATPNHGAEVARLAQLLQSRNPQFGDMTDQGNRYLEVVDDLWIKLMNARLHTRGRWPQAYCAYETKPTFGIRVVTNESARTQCDNIPYALESDHLGVVKPPSYNFPPYPWIAYQISTVRDTISATTRPFVTPTVAEAMLIRHLVTTARDTLIVLGRKDTTVTVSALSCGAVCTVRGNEKYLEFTLEAPPDFVLEKPTVSCVDKCSPVLGYSVRRHSLGVATASVTVTDAAATWTLSAELAAFRELISLSEFPPQRLVAGQEITVAVPANAKAVQLTLRSKLGVQVVDPTNLTGREALDLVSWEVDSLGTKTLRLRFSGRWQSRGIAFPTID
jgi:pimeloyl-ACP methyl ester carboxylesterase